MKNLKITVENDSTEKPKKYEDWEIRSKADTLMEAEQIKADKHLMKHIHKHLNTKKKAIKSVQDLRDLQSLPNYGIEDDESPQEETNDDVATKEPNETRIKNSKNPTTVGKVMK